MKLIFLFCLVVLCTSCKREPAYYDPRGPEFAGDQSCVQCHKSQHEDYLHTAHRLATAPALPEHMLGDFATHNSYAFDASTTVKVEQRGDSVYHVLYKGGKEVQAYPVGILFGTKHAQTSAYWKNHNTYELPVSYYTDYKSWGMSPGYEPVGAYFDRKIPKDCYACHASYAASHARTGAGGFADYDAEDVISQKNLLYGVDCERCHGPAKKHVDHHSRFPDEKQAKYIASFKSLTTKQQNDACAICHSGVDGVRVKPVVDFRPGEALEEYYRILPKEKYDVHGNQFAALSQSECFVKSGTMTCVSCHDPHKDSSHDAFSFGNTCMQCHKGVAHRDPQAASMNEKQLLSGCVGCHMPKQASEAITFRLAGKATPSEYRLATHRIAIYRNENP